MKIMSLHTLTNPIKGKWIYGAHAKTNQAYACVLNKHNPEGYLTMTIHKEILEEATQLGLEKPMVIYGMVNAGPNGSKSYIFESIIDEYGKSIINLP